MNTPPRAPMNDRAFEHLGALARESFPDGLSAGEQAGYGRLEIRMRKGGFPRRIAMLGLGAALAATAAVVFLVRAPAPPSLGFRAVGVNEAQGTPGRFEFSDGTHIAIEPTARASVTSIGPHGANLRLERGRLSTRFTHLPGAKWSITAGPFQVHVTGTAFDVAWSPETQSLELWLRQGSVEVKGASLGNGLIMRAGQHLRATAEVGQVLLDTEHSTEPTVEAAPTPARVDGTPPRERPAEPAVARPTRSPTTRAQAPSPSAVASPGWGRLLAKGDVHRVVSEAERMGIQQALAKFGPEDLSALADAARYVKRDDLATQTLLAERQRFPSSSAGKDAAFFLGGIEEGRRNGDGHRAALEWYRRYLVENPQGGYIGQALGRSMVLLEKVRDQAAARAMAVRYLAAFPDGPYAGRAKRIAGAP